jgi:hypothetical protein
MPTRPATRWWGKVSAKIAGLKAWHAQDADDWAKSWDDGGAAQKLGEHVTAEARRIIAEQTKEAVAEYAKDAEFALGVNNGAMMVGINISSASGRLIIQVPFVDLIDKATTDAYANAASPQAQDFLAALLKVAAGMDRLRSAMMPHNQQQREVA